MSCVVPEGVLFTERTPNDDQERSEANPQPREAGAAARDASADTAPAIFGRAGDRSRMLLSDVFELLLRRFVPHVPVLQC
jgi:hypothetical protein